MAAAPFSVRRADSARRRNRPRQDHNREAADPPFLKLRILTFRTVLSHFPQPSTIFSNRQQYSRTSPQPSFRTEQAGLLFRVHSCLARTILRGERAGLRREESAVDFSVSRTKVFSGTAPPRSSRVRMFACSGRFPTRALLAGAPSFSAAFVERVGFPTLSFPHSRMFQS